MTRWLLTPALLLAGCGASRALPELPALDASKQDAATREAYAAAVAAPKDAALAGQLGKVLHAHSQLAAAARAYERAAALDPATAEYSYLRGVALAADGHPAEAVAPLRAALTVPGARIRLGEALLAAARLAEARKEFEAALAADSNNARAHYGLGRCLQGAEAAAALEKALKLFPRYGAARAALAEVYRQQGRGAGAAALLRDHKADKLAAPPMHDPAMAAVAALAANQGGVLRAAQELAKQGQTENAIAALERAIGANPMQGQLWANLIPLYGRLNQFDKAESAYRQAISQQPRNVDAHVNYGLLCFRAKRFKEARLALEAAVELAPGHAEALAALTALKSR
jgi:tetratricopeptide (TPR) repeat protein